MTSPVRPTPLLVAALGTAIGLGTVSAAQAYHDGAFTGNTYSAYYGQVQVQAKVQNGKLSAVSILRYPSDRYTSRIIAHRALPQLEREAIQSQGSHVHTVSGATLTSQAFMESLHSALQQAL